MVHDRQERQLYFDNATFLIRGTPVFWIPRTRLPDPTLKRATGFLIPSIRTTNLLGTGIKIPYFIKMGDHRDLTLTPYLSYKTTTLDVRYRQAFTNGEVEVNFSLSKDDLVEGRNRVRFFANGNFDLGREFELTFDIETASDSAYLLDYGYSTKDRLDSAFQVRRIREHDLFVADLTYYRSLRDGESNAALPPFVADIRYERRSQVFGGTLNYGLSADTIVRFGTAVDEVARDVARVGGQIGWRDQWVHHLDS